ncbi:MAG TPA: thiamine diphosphokinase [Clostridiales bacterium]|nr:thiamine diphosphokinase [Clostridiales bacterium]
MTALIIGNGSDIEKSCIENIKIDYVICADGGLEKAERFGLVPDLILGDFDSVDPGTLARYKSLNIETVTFSAEKDYTDMELAVEYAVKKGYKNIVLAGASGTRLDHTVANIQLLEKYHIMGIDMEVIDNNNHISIISGKTVLKIKRRKNYFVSMAPVTETIEGLTLEGFKYPLDNVKVKRGSTLLVSNEITQDEGSIILEKGTALVFVSKD